MPKETYYGVEIYRFVMLIRKRLNTQLLRLASIHKTNVLPKAVPDTIDKHLIFFE